LIYTNLKNTLIRNGVKEIEAKGLVFNPDTMEAITQIPMDGMSGKVVDVVEKGYEISGKILRFTKVVVGA
jgi:molecular chaperone GrpE